MKLLRIDELESIKEKLIDIAEDGTISDDEKPEMRKILTYLDELAKTISEIRTIGYKALNGGENNGNTG